MPERGAIQTPPFAQVSHGIRMTHDTRAACPLFSNNGRSAGVGSAFGHELRVRLEDPAPLFGRQAIDVEHAVEMIGLVLQAAGE